MIPLTSHQTVMLEMLKEVDRICQEHQIPYQLFAGTALGAVRHQGFIPWDDDLDIILLRDDYDRFFQIAEQELNKEKYTLQKEFTSHWPLFFSKLRRNNTTCLERFIPRDPLMHQGIYIDIFPCDALCKNRIGQFLQFLASKVIIAKSLEHRGYRTNNIMKKLFILLCRLFPEKCFHSFVLQQKHSDSRMVHCFLGGASSFHRSIFPREWLSESILLPFENESYPVSRHYDLLLRRMYGDYRIPLPPEQREQKIHAVLVDTEHSYELYIEQQKSMKFHGYGRSIR